MSEPGFSSAEITATESSKLGSAPGLVSNNVDASASLHVSTSIPSIIPEMNEARRRTIVLCFDGTGDQYDADNSNVVQLFSLLQKDNHTEQMVYYQAGIGTYTVPQVVSPLMSKISKTLDTAVAWNLHTHVMEGYTFLMQNYQRGDKICIFGFSRGAYTARSLAGMVHKVGLLPAGNHQQVPFAYNMYTRCDDIGWKQSSGFKKAFSVNVDIEFVGVWDTVCSVGIIPRRLPFVSSNTAIRYFRHAVSLDERRAKFKANLYNRPTEEENKLGVQPGEMPLSSPKPSPPSPTRFSLSPTFKFPIFTPDAGIKIPDIKLPDIKPVRRASTQSTQQEEIRWSQQEQQFDYESCVSHGYQHGRDCDLPETDVLEVWFAGCHCDVGGGSVANETPNSLARIPLRWMIRECFKAKTGIRFHSDMLRKVGLDPESLYPIVKPRPAALYKAPSVQDNTEVHNRRASVASSIAKDPIEDDTLRVPPPMHDRQDSDATVLNSPLDTTEPSGDVKGKGVSKFLTEEEEDLKDALSPIYDQLKIKKAWWTLEIIPLRQRYQKPDNTWKDDLIVNRGRPRIIPRPDEDDKKINVHRSVKVRMEAKGHVEGEEDGVYVPRAEFPHEPNWVD